MPPAAVETELK